MALNTVTSLNIGNASDTTLGNQVIPPKVVDTFLKVFEPNLLFRKYSEAPIAEDGYQSVIWLRPNRLTLTPAQALMDPGVTPVSTNISIDQIETKSKQYGIYVTLTDELLYRLSGKNIPSVATDLVGKNMARIMDRVVQDEVLDNATNRYFAATTSGGARAANRAALTSNNKIFSYDITDARRRLQNTFAPYFSGDGTYVCIMHPNVYFSLLTETSVGSFFDVNRYKRPERIDNADVGIYSNVKIVVSSFVKTYQSNITVYPTVIFGEQAFGASQLSAMEMITKPLGSSGTADPLNQRMTTGAKAYFSSKILQQASILVFESAGVS